MANLVLSFTVPSTMLNPMSTTIFQFSTNSTDVIISPWCPVSWVHLHHSSAFWPWSGVVSLLTSFLFGTFSTQIPYSGLQIAASHSGKENQIKSGFFCVCVFICLFFLKPSDFQSSPSLLDFNPEFMPLSLRLHFFYILVLFLTSVPHPHLPL